VSRDSRLGQRQDDRIEATTLEANAALRSIVRRDSGERYEEFLTTLAKASGIGMPTRADLARIDRKRKKKDSNDDWTHPHDPYANITKMKDGRTHLAHKAEHAIDLETGAIVGVTVQDADKGDTSTIQRTLPEATKQLEAVAAVTVDAVMVIEEVVADEGYHSRTTVHDLRLLRSAPTSASRTADLNRGWINAPNVMPCMPIAGVSVGLPANASFADARNCSTVPARTSTTPAVYVARTSAATRTC